MSTNDNQNNRSNKRNVYSNSDLRSYDRYISSLGFSFFNSLGTLSLSAISPDAIGKEPKSGDKVYDHENALKVYISAAVAVRILNGIKFLKQSIKDFEENPEDGVQPKMVTIPFGKDRKLTLMVPGASKITVKDGSGKRVSVDTTESYVLRVSMTDSEGTQLDAMHVLQNDSIVLTDINKEEYEITTHIGLEMLEAFLSEVISLGTGSYRQGTVLGLPSNGNSNSSGKGKSPFATQSMSDDDDDVEEEDDSPKSKPKSKTTKVLEDEFDDE